MDFFSYLQNSGSKKQINKNNEIKLEINKKNQKDIIDDDINEKHIVNFNFKRGEMVLIIRHENSIFNIYKGYYAEIKQYRENSLYAYVILPALNFPSRIKIPIAHFKKIDK